MNLKSTSLNVVLDKASQGIWNSVPYLTALLWLEEGYLEYYQHLSLVLVLSSIGFAGAERGLVASHINLTSFIRQTLGLRVVGVLSYLIISITLLKTNYLYLISGAAIISFNRTSLVEFAYLGKHVAQSLWPIKAVVLSVGITARLIWQQPEIYLLIFAIETILLATAFTLSQRAAPKIQEILLKWSDFKFTLSELVLVFVATKIYLLYLPKEVQLGDLKLMHVFDYLPFLVGITNNLMHVNQIKLRLRSVFWATLLAIALVFATHLVAGLDLISTAYLGTKVFATLSTFIAFTFYRNLDFRVVFTAGLIAFIGVILYFPMNILLPDASIFWYMLISQGLCFAYFVHQIFKLEYQS